MKTSIRLLSTVVLLIAVTFLGAPQRVSAGVRPMAKTFTGEQVFRGLFFGEAPVSQLFPEIWTNERVKYALSTKERVLEFNQMKDALVKWVKISDPGLMERFGREMQSGDHLRIQTAFQEAGQKISIASQSLGYITPDGASRDCIAGPVIVFYAFAVLVAVVLATVISAFEVRTGGGPLPKRPILGDESKLYNDMIVNAVAERLDASKENVPMVPIPLPQ